MGVTPLSSARVSLAVVLNACLGLFALQSLIPRIRISLTVILGPSLILGGALSFVVFQALGRGTAGIAAIASAGGLAALSVVRKNLTFSKKTGLNKHLSVCWQSRHCSFNTTSGTSSYRCLH